jgi:hypothetical protein
VPEVHERDEWLAGYVVAKGEKDAWWGGNTFPSVNDITNITWHYPGGDVALTAAGQYAAELRNEQSAYHRRRDGGGSGHPPPFDQGYDLGYNAMISPDGHIWKVRWTDKRCAANGSSVSNGISFAVQFMMPYLNSDITPPQISAARYLDHELRKIFPNIPAGVAGHKGHRNWYATSCPGDRAFNRMAAGELLYQGEPPPIPIPVPGENDLMHTLIIVDDAYARFAGDSDNLGIIHTMRWLGQNLNAQIGFKEDNVTPRLDGTKVLHRKQAELNTITRVGPLPSGDKVEWREDHFYQGG